MKISLDCYCHCLFFFRIKRLLGLLCRPCGAGKRMEAKGLELEVRFVGESHAGDITHGGLPTCCPALKMVKCKV